MEFIDSEEETEIQDLRQLLAVLESERASTCDSISQCSTPTVSTCISSTQIRNERSKLEEALMLNKLTDEKLQRLENILIGRLQECRQKLNTIHDMAMVPEKQETFRYGICGKPYFKDKANFPAPDNADTLLMTRTQMYDFSEVSTVLGWTVKDKDSFITVIHEMSKDIKRRELKSKIAQLHREAKLVNNKEHKKKIKAVVNEMNAINKKTLDALVLPVDEEYDWDVVSNRLNCRHSPQEYRSMWKLFLHPSINKSSWSDNEHTTLQGIIENHNSQDWDMIAKLLNTGRTGYQCFVYYRTNIMCNITIGQKWTEDEEMYLRRLIDYYKVDRYIPWGKVAASMMNRTKLQIYNKYLRLIERRKGRFLPEEDEVILTCIEKFGPNFKKVAKYLAGRSARQIRVRYNVLHNCKTSTVWTIEEDKKLVKMLSDEDMCTNYSKVAKHFPGKLRSHLRTRYITLVRWMMVNPNADIAEAPRRGPRRLPHGDAKDSLKVALQRLNRKIQAEVDLRKSKYITKESTEDAIERSIINTLVEEIIIEENIRLKAIQSKEQEIINEDTYVPMKVDAKNLHKVLIILKARLNLNRFKNSTYHKEYPGLIETPPIVPVKVRTYSKKSAVRPINGQKVLDIWGNSSLNCIYVLPPSYDTMTGCRKILAFILASQLQGTEHQVMNLKILSKRNRLLKEQMISLIERINFLFMWPMLLCSRNPHLPTGDAKPHVNIDEARRAKVVGYQREVVIPNIHIMKKMAEAAESDKIDLDEKDNTDNGTVIELNCNDDFLYTQV